MIVGDLNAPDINWSDLVAHGDEFQRQLLETIVDLNMVQHCLQPTRFSIGHTSSILDVVITPNA